MNAADKAKKEAEESARLKSEAEAKAKEEAAAKEKAEAEQRAAAEAAAQRKAEVKVAATDRNRRAPDENAPVKASDPYPSQADLDAMREGKFHRTKRDLRPEGVAKDYKTR